MIGPGKDCSTLAHTLTLADRTVTPARPSHPPARRPGHLPHVPDALRSRAATDDRSAGMPAMDPATPWPEIARVAGVRQLGFSAETALGRHAQLAVPDEALPGRVTTTTMTRRAAQARYPDALPRRRYAPAAPAPLHAGPGRTPMMTLLRDTVKGPATRRGREGRGSIAADE
ncbi:hypothetical protein [Nonomuraea guangzhouensis]|uniref:Uncharacterized protein n=1 Tax=Nonomuraea guangzhouensis TaxID=1291555 RepID=A0ABW4G4N8_9ACTN